MKMENFSKYADKLKGAYRAGYLISGFIQKNLTIEEEEELDRWIEASEDNMLLFEDLTEESRIDDFLKWYATRDTEAQLKVLKKRMRFTKRSKLVLFWRYAAAACIVALIGFAIYVFEFGEGQISIEAGNLKQDIPPGSMKAMLTLSNGQVVVLGNQDTIINDQVRIKAGEIIYSLSHEAAGYHEIAIPRKGYYKLVLPDGTRVWLNAESSIRYPSAFTSAERTVEMTGEAFFEVARDASKPFVVAVNGIAVTALGTAFNINAYPNEGPLTATLVEGSIRVSNQNKQVVLQANQQVKIAGDDWKLSKHADISSITAWMNNRFKLKNHTIEEIMRMVERWYDVKVIYEDTIDFHFNGEIDRGLPVSELLKSLEATGHVHFSINEGTITVRK